MRENTGDKAIVKKIQDILYQILCDIDDFCQENNIRYYLSGGTCLGAIRHQGFIPWDDDADLMMPREDYLRFLKSFSEKFEGKYEVGSLFTDSSWQRPTSRVCDLHSRLIPLNLKEKPMGIFVDIFPIDGLPISRAHRWVYYKYLRLLNGLRNSSIRTEYKDQEGYRIIKSISSIVTKKIGPRRFAIMQDAYASHFSYNSSFYVAASLPIHYGAKETIEKKYVEDSVQMRFVDRMFPVPVGYDKYLTNLYGDYMSIPKGAEENGYTHLHGWRLEL